MIAGKGAETGMKTQKIRSKDAAWQKLEVLKTPCCGSPDRFRQ